MPDGHSCSKCHHRRGYILVPRRVEKERDVSQLQAEIESARATGNSLIVNMKNTGTKKITRESIVSILPHPGGTVQTEQSVYINPGETKTLIFTWIEGNFMIDTTYMAVMQLTDEINSVSIPFSVQTQ